MNKIIRYTTLFISFSLLIISGGCKTPTDISYFQDIKEETFKVESPGQIKIAPNDRLTIMVKTMDPVVSALFNLNVLTDRMVETSNLNSGKGTLGASTSSSNGISKYTVTSQGNIDFPVLGQIHVAGMTRSELAAFIKGEIEGKNLAKNPIVTVEFLNMGISILGEVNEPGRYDINQDQINIIEAISMAGDLNINGKRENISVIREDESGVHTYKVDITNFKELHSSPAYYLKQGDIIYVEPTDMRKRQATNNGNNVFSTSFWISLGSLVTSFITTLAVFIKK